MKKKYSKHYISELIEKAWCDKTTFDDISFSDCLKEDDIKKILKKNLKKGSYIHWRKRIKKNKASLKFYKNYKPS